MYTPSDEIPVLKYSLYIAIFLNSFPKQCNSHSHFKHN